MKYLIKSDEAQATLTTDGAMLCSLQKDGTEYLWQGDAAYWAGQAPVCFPIVGVLPGGEAKAFGKPCKMKRHGIARITPFIVEAQSADSVTFLQHSSEETKKAFPFDYELRIRYTIEGSAVTNEYLVKNTGDSPLPFVIGGHPAFNCPLTEGETFEDYRVVFSKAMTKAVLRPDHETGLVDVNKRYPALDNSDTLPLTHDLFEEKDAMIFDSIEAKSATLIGKAGRGIRIDFPDMENLLIWSACGNAPFVALEPWSGISHCSDESEAFENKRGMTVLQSGESKRFKFIITMIS